MAGLVRRQALELSPSRFDFDLRRLLTVLDRTITEMQPTPAATGQGRPAVTQRDAHGQDRQEAGRAAAQHRQQVEQLQQQIREHGAARDWDAVLAVNDQLAALDPAAADPDGLASTAREQITRDRDAGGAKAGAQESAGAQDGADLLQAVPRTSSAARKRRRLIAAAIGSAVVLAAVIIPVMLLGGGNSPAARMVKLDAVRAGDCFRGVSFAKNAPYPYHIQVCLAPGNMKGRSFSQMTNGRREDHIRATRKLKTRVINQSFPGVLAVHWRRHRPTIEANSTTILVPLLACGAWVTGGWFASPMIRQCTP